MEQNRQDSRHRRRWLLAAGVALVALVALTLWQARDAVAQTAGRLVYGATVDGEVGSLRGEEWTFTGCQDDEVTIRVSSDEFDAFVELYGPGSRRPLIDDDNSGGGTDAAIEEFALPESGVYSIVAVGAARGDRGAYTLTLAAAGVEPDPEAEAAEIALAYGETVDGEVVSARGQEWSFYGCAGDVVDVAVVGDEFAPYLELYAPDTRRPVASAEGDAADSIELTGVELAESGLYTLAILGATRTERGAYTLTLATATDSDDSTTSSATGRSTPTRTPRPSATPDAAAADAPAGLCTVVSAALNMRPGPGLNFTPPVALLDQDALLLPLGRNDDASWIQAEALDTGDVGWVSADTRFVTCEDDPADFPVSDDVPAPTATPTFSPTPRASASATPTPRAAASGGSVPAPVALTYGNKNFSWRWSGLDAIPAGVDWYFDVKIFNNEFSEFPYDVKVAELADMERKGDEWFYLKTTDFRCGSYWAVQIAQRNADGSYAGPLSPESNRIPTNRGCEDPLAPPVPSPAAQQMSN
ncbi:MAG: hypothetical protein KDE20_03235 [Caldilineaceae bacterium]|nr:hypothetical protein [Caldilineaceae bacterium]